MDTAEITTKDQLIAAWTPLAERASGLRHEAASIRLEEMELLIVQERLMDEALMANILKYGDQEEAAMLRTRIEDNAGEGSMPFYDEILMLKHDLLAIDSGEPDEYDWDAMAEMDDAA